MAAISDESPRGVGETALGAAMMRMRESTRADPLFVDPLAAAFVEAAPPVFEEGPSADDDPELARLEAAFADAVSVRTRFYDDFVLGELASGVRQVVLLGAGLDSRAFRLAWPLDAQVFEVDTPAVLTFKERVIAEAGFEPACNRNVVAADLGQDWRNALSNAGFLSTDRTCWLVEGLFPYLSNEEAQALLVTVGEMSYRGASLALDQPTIPEGSLLAQAQSMQSMADITSMWKGGLNQNTVMWLDERGWKAKIVTGPKLACRYRRMYSAVVGSDFVTATRLATSAAT